MTDDEEITNVLDPQLILALTEIAYANVQQAQIKAHSMECQSRTMAALERIANHLESFEVYES